MVGGTVIANDLIIIEGLERRRLWCIDRRSSDECAVHCDIDGGKDVRPGDWIWWQSGKIYWTRHVNGDPDQGTEFVEIEIPKVGYSYDPRPSTLPRDGVE